MKIGIDISQTGNSKTGCGYYAYSLVKSLAEIDSKNDYILYPSFGDFYLDPDWNNSTIKINRSNFQRGLGHHTMDKAQSFWRTPPADYESQLGNPDIIHSINYYCPLELKEARLVYSLADLVYMTNPEWTTEVNRVGCFTGAFNASIHAEFIIMLSEYIRQQFHQYFPHYSLERTKVIPLASRYLGLPEPMQTPIVSSLTPDHFWLNVGTVEPRKNQIRLLQAYAELKSKYQDSMPLVMVGGKGWLMDDFEKSIKNLNLDQSVIWLGYVDDLSLQWLYCHCFGFLYPSLSEGFGLPVLEAMSQGAAVITSNTSSIPEVIGDSGLQINPYDENEILLAMEKITENEGLRQEMKKKAAQRAFEFSWEKTAKKTLEVYQMTLMMDKY